MALIEVGSARVEHTRSGAGAPLVLVHSLLTELTVFDTVLPALEQHHAVTRVNLPGFGASSPVKLASVADYADHLARVMDALDLPRDTAVFGNGFGAFVVTELAIRHGGRFGKLVVADVVPAFPEPARVPFRVMAQKVGETGMAAVLDTAIGRMFPPAFAAAHPDVIADRKAKLGAVDPGCFAQACLGLAGLDLAPRLAAIAKPVLVLCGDLDQTTPPALARALAEGIRGARYADITGSGHCPMLEQPAALVEALRGFLG